MSGAPGWNRSGANYLKPERRRIIGTSHHQMESSMAGAADQARPAARPAQEAIVPGRPETLAEVPQIQKGEIHQLNMRRGLQIEEPEVLAMEV